MIFNVVDLALKGKLPQNEFPIVAGDMPYSQSSLTSPASNVILFIVGGVTFEEAKEIALSFN